MAIFHRYLISAIYMEYHKQRNMLIDCNGGKILTVEVGQRLSVWLRTTHIQVVAVNEKKQSVPPAQPLLNESLLTDILHY